MDDLISRAAVIAEVEEWAEHGYDAIHWTGIKAMLETQPTVDAIPVEWLEGKRERMANAGQDTPDQAIAYVLWLWQKEQEANTDG